MIDVFYFYGHAFFKASDVVQWLVQLAESDHPDELPEELKELVEKIVEAVERGAR